MADEQGNEQGLSLRDSLMAAVEQHRETETDDAGRVEESAPAAPASVETAAEQAARVRDDAGRFARAEAKDSAAAPSPAGQSAGAQPAVVAPTVAAVAPPSSWRKDRHEAFSKLDPETQNYILQREREYATGVSTYKAEAERSRSLQAAMEPFTPILQQHNIQPEQWITNLGNAHRALALGSPQQRAQMFTQLARDYGVDLSQLVGQPGQQQPGAAVDPNLQWMQGELNKVRAQLDSFNAQQAKAKQEAEYQQQLAIEKMITDFRADTVNYPHFETVQETMSGLLQAGLAQDLKSAYDKALRMHDDLWQSQQESQKANAEAERKRLAAQAAATARGKVVSVKPSTPAGQAASASSQGRRAQLQEAFASHSGSRV